jgi:taurine dioxygenase
MWWRYNVQRHERRLRRPFSTYQGDTRWAVGLAQLRGRYSDRGKKDTDVDCPEAVHPIVRTHPDTGRKSLFVNRTFTTKIVGLSDSESDAILEIIFEHAEHINYQIRYRWTLYDMAFWDNRCCMHRAIWDYWPAERKGRRVTVKGDKPV